jgi:hypothetical protein
MREASLSFKPICWYAITSNGLTNGSVNRESCISSDVRYYIQEAEERRKTAGLGAGYIWLKTFVLYDATFTECQLEEEGLTGKFLSYTQYSTGGESQCSFRFTDKAGNISFQGFTGDVKAFPKAISYLEGLSKHANWQEAELQTKKLEIQRLKKVVAELQEENRRLKQETNKSGSIKK